MSIQYTQNGSLYARFIPDTIITRKALILRSEYLHHMYSYIFTHLVLQISRNRNLKKAVTNRATPKEGLFRDWLNKCALFPGASYSCKTRLSIARNHCGCRKANCFLETREEKESGKVVEVQMMHQTHFLCKYTVLPTFSGQGYSYIVSEFTLYLALCNGVRRGRSVGIATRYGFDGPGIESPRGRDFPCPSRPSLGPNQPPKQWVGWNFPRSKTAGAGSGVEYQPPSSSEGTDRLYL
jgi:hypothetical protein